MGNPRNFYSAKEDICIAEALIDTGWIFREYGLKKTIFPQVYNGFVTKVSKFGIDGSVRTTKSLESRIYVLKEAVNNGRLREHAGCDNPLLERRHDLLLRAFGIGQPPRAQPSSALHTPQRLRLAPRTHKAGRASVFGKSVIPRKPRHKGIQKEQQMNSKRLLYALHLKYIKRIDGELEREEAVRRQQEVDQTQRKRNMHKFRYLVQSASSQDDVIDFLKLLEDLNAEDTERCMLREVDARDRIESDWEKSKWERSVFEKLTENGSI